MNFEKQIRESQIPQLRGALLMAGWKLHPRNSDGMISPRGTLYRIPPRPLSELDWLSINMAIEEVREQTEAPSIQDLVQSLIKRLHLVYLGPELPGLAPGTIPAHKAGRFYADLSRFVRASVQKGGQNVKASKSRQKRLLQKVVFGEVIASSYVVSIHVPVGTHPDSINDESVAVLSLAFDELDKASRSINSDVISEGSWSVDMCESLAQMLESTGASQLKARVLPSIERPDMPRADVVIGNEGNRASEALLHWAREARGLKERQKVEISGPIYFVRDPNVINESGVRVIGVQWQRPDGASPLKVHVVLKDREYEQARSQIGRKALTVTGYLEQQGTRWVLQGDGEALLTDLLDDDLVTEDPDEGGYSVL